MRKFFTSLLIIMLGVFHAQAQDKIVTGTVFDETGLSLPGASVLIKGTTTGTETDFDGKFQIIAKQTDVLVISFIGYATQEITVGTTTEFNVNLEPDLNSLDEVQLIAFGSQKKKSVVASISTVKPSELKVASSNLTTALAGRVSGLIAFQRGGEPGADNAEFFIRGVTTFGYGSGPLILIDGVELTTDDLRKLHPDDIASFSIMKDATATSLYGARGANGVIYVTTKEGTEGTVRVSARVETSYSTSTRDIELADPITYMKMGNEAVKTRDPLGILPYSLKKIANTQAGTNPLLYPTTDWHDELFEDYANNKKFNFSLNGGGKTARYYVSLAGSQDNGVLKVPESSDFNNNIKYKQYNLRSNVNINLTETSKLKLSFNLNSDDYNGPIGRGNDYYNMAMRSNPVLFAPSYPNEGEYEHTNHILFGNFGEGNYLNPYAQMSRGYEEEEKMKLIAQVEFKQDLDFVTDGLDFKFVYNATKESAYAVDRFYNPYYYAPRENLETGEIRLTPLNEEEGTEYLNFLQKDRFVSNTNYLEANLSYLNEINDLNSVSGLLVFTMNNRLTTLSLQDSRNLEKSLPYRNMGLAGRFTYARSNKYFAELNFGYNGSERFEKSERWGFFPSIGLGWQASDEEFMQGASNVITNLKFKASYGLVGNDRIGGSDDRFFYLSKVNMNSGFYATGEDFDNFQSGISIDRYANDEITWETAKKLNVGFELGLFNEFELSVDVFSEDRSNILWDRILPSTLGLQAGVRANVGEARSQGIDGTLVYTKNFSNGAWLQFRGNYTYATNEITKLEEPDFSATPWLSRVGQPINQQWGYVAERLFVDQDEVNNSPEQAFGGDYSGGDIKYKDINEDGKITALDRVPIGNPTVPDMVYGFGLSSGFKGFDASFFFQGSANSSFWINNGNSIGGNRPWNHVIPFVGESQLLKVWADDYWSETDRNVYAKWPRLSNELVPNNAQASTWFMQDGAFLRLKTVEIGYTLSEKFTSKLKMEKIRFYTTGTNLFVLSDFKLWDPELAGNGLNYPNQRVFNVGLNISL